MTEAILLSARPSLVDVDDATRHLETHSELYWTVPFPIKKSNFALPLFAFVHMSGGQVEYRLLVTDIVPFSAEQYEDPALAANVKPPSWRAEWLNNPQRRKDAKTSLVVTEIVPFSYNTLQFYKPDGERIKLAPRSYVSVVPPNEPVQQIPTSKKQRVTIAEKNLEDFVIDQLESIESGLRLVERQLSTDAGRLDLLCEDKSGAYVVVELKKMRGSDQVVGQTLRYMGWVKEAHPEKRVRGIVVVGKSDDALRYALRAAPEVEAKVFRVSIEDMTS